MVIETDFTSVHSSSLWSPRLRVGSMLLLNLALGFTEGCLAIEHRPIPLRFALRFAAANVLPSIVWSSVSARHVARASCIPLSTLITNGKVADTLSVSIAKRLVLVKSVRAMRMAVGSYGFAWTLWRGWHEETGFLDSNNDKMEVGNLTERVVRLAPVHSPLSHVSSRQHANHVIIMPIMTNKRWTWQSEKNKALDWKNVGINVKLDGKQDEKERMKVIEVEINDIETTVARTQELQTQALKSENSVLCSVAVLPPSGPVLSTSMMDTFDVCFNPLSAVLTFIASICYDRGENHVILVLDEDEDGEAAGSLDAKNMSTQHLSPSQLVTGLLYRYGITTSVVKTREKELSDEFVDNEATVHQVDDTNSGVVFFLAENLDAGRTIAKKLTERGIVMQEKACFIVEETLCSQSTIREKNQAQSALLEKTNVTEMDEDLEAERNDTLALANYFSVADVSDQTLQGIRKLLRQGITPDIIQAALYRAYGTQRVVAPKRLDQYSNLDL